VDSQQTSTQIQKPPQQNAEDVESEKLLTLKQEEFISYKAMDGWIHNNGEAVRRMTLTEFADYLKVDRGTLYYWQNHIQNFWDRVNARRDTIISRDVLQKVWARVIVDALAGSTDDKKLILQVGGWKPPAQAHDVNVTGLADLANIARRRQAEKDRDVIDAN